MLKYKYSDEQYKNINGFLPARNMPLPEFVNHQMMSHIKHTRPFLFLIVCYKRVVPHEFQMRLANKEKSKQGNRMILEGFSIQLSIQRSNRMILGDCYPTNVTENR